MIAKNAKKKSKGDKITLKIDGVSVALLAALEEQGRQQRPPVSRNDWIIYQLEEVAAGTTAAA